MCKAASWWEPAAQHSELSSGQRLLNWSLCFCLGSWPSVLNWPPTGIFPAPESGFIYACRLLCFMWASFAQTHFRVKATVLPESGLPRDEHPTLLPQPLCPQHHLHSLRCLASLPFLQMYWVRPVNRSWHLLFPQPGAPSSGISMACPCAAFRSQLRLLSLSLPLVS